MKILTKNNLTRHHALSFTILFLIFTTLTYLATNAGIDQGNDHHRLVLLTTANTITGPFTGAIARNFQGCCLDFSLSLLTYAATILAVGIISQFIPLPENKLWSAILRHTLWITAWFIWFATGIVSFAHALN